jgi:hypothetical protein
MGSVASTNNGLSDLLQTLTNDNSPLLPTLSSPAVEAALENAPATDIVEISAQAVQLQEADTLFGISNTPTTPTDSLYAALASPGSSVAAATPGSLYDVFA